MPDEPDASESEEPAASEPDRDLDLYDWDPWTPAQVRDLLADLDAPWCVVAGWALDLFRGTVTRRHADIEIAIPWAAHAAVRARLTGFDLYVAGDGEVRPLARMGEWGDWYQTWARDPTSGRWRLDVMCDPHDGDTWICRRDHRIRRPYAELIERDADGIPYLRPEYALLFKAKQRRPKDEADFAGVLPLLSSASRRELAADLAVCYGGDHPWIAALGAYPDAFEG